jgi:hypothetical protein
LPPPAPPTGWQLLSDNHTSFTGRLFGFQSAFERKLHAIGVELINAAPAHPQTLGKLERFHRTLKESLEDEGPASDLEHLQLLLDRFRTHYKRRAAAPGHWRPDARRALPPGSPAARAGAEPAPAEQEQDPAYHCRSLAIILGRRFAGATVRIVEVGELVHVYSGEECSASWRRTAGRRYQRLNSNTIKKTRR